MKKKTIYISIPITGHDLNKQREKADLIKAKLSKEGYAPINPFEIYQGAKKPTYGQLMGADLATLIDHAQGIYMCEGWELSHGCKIEHFTAAEFGKFIIYEVSQ